jgi:hypothetical protein
MQYSEENVLWSLYQLLPLSTISDANCQSQLQSLTSDAGMSSEFHQQHFFYLLLVMASMMREKLTISEEVTISSKA